jgi:uncharacterized protein YndB with AHSA1/START domain
VIKTKEVMHFSIDMEKQQIKVERDFEAALSKVWEAWTTSRLLDQWWAPKPWKSETKIFDFKEGGYWLYAMVSPEGEKHWARTDFHNIKHEKSYTAKDAFCNEQGTINEAMPVSEWRCEFTEKDGMTTVMMKITFIERADLTQTMNMGFKEGFTAGLENLDELLASKSP